MLFTLYRQENAIFSHHIHTTWEKPFRESLYLPCPALPLTEIYDGAIERGEGELILGAVTIVETRTDAQ